MTNLRTTYQERFAVLEKLAIRLEGQLKEYLQDEERVDRIGARPKSLDRFVKKAEAKTADGRPKYDDPINQIQDQIGARVITFYLSDIDRIVDVIKGSGKRESIVAVSYSISRIKLPSREG